VGQGARGRKVRRSDATQVPQKRVIGEIGGQLERGKEGSRGGFQASRRANQHHSISNMKRRKANWVIKDIRNDTIDHDVALSGSKARSFSAKEGKESSVLHRTLQPGSRGQKSTIKKAEPIKKDLKATSKTKGGTKSGQGSPAKGMKTPEHAAHISAYHALEKRIAASKDPKEMAQLKLEQEKLGGLKAYQEASITGGDKLKGGETGKWFVKEWLQLYGKNEVGQKRSTMFDGHELTTSAFLDPNAGRWRNPRHAVRKASLDKGHLDRS